MGKLRSRFGLAGAVLCFTVQAALHAQGGIPATAPTTITPWQLPSANPPVPVGHAEVAWDGRLLQLTTDGESLNRVLQRIAQQTGVHLSGSLPDERVYGTYGPAPLVEIVAKLMDGLPVNVLFVDRSGVKPPELVLTSRNGGATPPGSSFAQANASGQPPANAGEPAQPSPVQGVANSGGAPGNPPGAVGAGGTPANGDSTDASSATQQSPNGVKTPQEIFEQLQRLRATANANR